MGKKKASKKKTGKKKAGKKKGASKTNGKKRSYVPQSKVPACPLESASRIAEAIAEHCASDPSAPLDVAYALKMAPTSSIFRDLCGASIAYGLTEGGCNAAEISLTSIGKRITRPIEEGDDLAAKREALLKPTVIDAFLKKYDGSPIPREDIGQNVLIGMGVPDDRAKSVLDLIIGGAERLGLVKIIKNKKYIHLAGVAITSSDDDENESDIATPPLVVVPDKPHHPHTN